MGVSNIIWKPALLKTIEVDVSWVVIPESAAAAKIPKALQSISKDKGYWYGLGCILSSQFKLASGSWKWEKCGSVLHCLGIVECSFKVQSWCETGDLKSIDGEAPLVFVSVCTFLFVSLVFFVIEAAEKEGWNNSFTETMLLDWKTRELSSKLFRSPSWWWIRKWFWSTSVGAWSWHFTSVDGASSNGGKEQDMGGDETSKTKPCPCTRPFFFSPVLWNILQITHSSCRATIFQGR